jgi:outer membrane protein assembly factor BamA
LRSVPFAIFVLLFLPCVILAQPAPCRDHSSLWSHKSPGIKINVVGVEFTGQNSLPDELRAELVDKIRDFKITASPNDPDTDWPNALVGRIVRKALQSRGYFRSSWELTPYLVKAETDQRSYIVSIAIDTGLAYHVGNVHVRDATVFPRAELLELIPLKTDDVLNDEKIREAIESMQRMYAQKGYVAMTAGTTMGIDHVERRIEVNVEVEEGKQYRVGTIEVSGLDSNTANILKSSLELGQVFDGTIIKKILTENRGTLPADSSEKDVMIERDSEEGTVAIVFDFRRCSGTQTADSGLYSSNK